MAFRFFAMIDLGIRYESVETNIFDTKPSGSQGLQDTDEWYAPQILKSIEENAEGITPKKTYDALLYQVQSHDDLKQELIGRYGQQDVITQAFEDNNF